MTDVSAARRALGVPAPQILHDQDGPPLAYQRIGQGPPVVCLHPIAHGGRDFMPFAARVKDRYEVIALDWPGHGRSGDEAERPTSRRYAHHVDRLVRGLGLERPILLGCSIGAGAAIAYAAENPVAGVVLCDSAGLVELDPTVRRVVGAMARLFDAGARGRWWFRYAYALYYRMVLPRAPEDRARVVAAGPAMAAVLRDAWTGFAEPEADLRAMAAQIDAPVLAAWARGDRVIPLARCRDALLQIRDVRIETFRGGHEPFLEDLDVFERSFRAFADALSRSRAVRARRWSSPPPRSRGGLAPDRCSDHASPRSRR